MIESGGRPAYPQLEAGNPARVQLEQAARSLDEQATRAASLGDTNQELQFRRQAAATRAVPEITGPQPTSRPSAPMTPRTVAPAPEVPRVVTPELPPLAPRGAPNTTTARGITDPSQLYDFRYRVAPLDSLVPSHLDNFAENPAYPQELQPRVRDRAAAQLQVEKIARELQPDALLEDGRQLDRGPMIVGPDYRVESGNGRTLALRRAREAYPQNLAAYEQRLLELAPQYGLTREQVRATRNPVLVRERTTPVDRAAFTREANARATLAMGPMERAREDAAALTDETLSSLRVTDSQTLDEALRSVQNVPFIRAFLEHIPPNDQAELVTPDGLLNLQGAQRVKEALFQRTYPGTAGQRLANTFFESQDPLVKNIQSAMEASLPQLARAEALVRSGARAPELAIGDDLARAVNVLARLKQEGASVSAYLANASMFDRELNPFQEQLLAALNERARAPRQVRELLQDYAGRVESAGDARQAAMFGPARVEDKGAVLDDLLAQRRAAAEPSTAGPLFAEEGAAAAPAANGPRLAESSGASLLPNFPTTGPGSQLGRIAVGAVQGAGGGAASEFAQAKAEGREPDYGEAARRGALGAVLGGISARMGLPTLRPGDGVLGLKPIRRRPINEGGLARRGIRYPAGSPEALTEQALVKSAEASADGLAHLTAAEVAKLPGAPKPRPATPQLNPKTGKPVKSGVGMARSTDDLRMAVDAGLPFTRWYTEFSDGASQIVGRDRMREFATLFGVTSQQTPPAQNFGYTIGGMRIIRELAAEGLIDETTPDARALTLLEQRWREQRWQKYDKQGNPVMDKQGNPVMDKWKFTGDQIKKVWSGYKYGVAEVKSNAKTSSYSGSIGEALDLAYDENATLDTWMAQLHGYDFVNWFATSDPGYRHVQAQTHYLGRELGILSHEAQAAQWFTIRQLTQNRKTKHLVDLVNEGKMTLADAIEQGDKLGVFAPTQADGDLASVLKNPQVRDEVARSLPVIQSEPGPFMSDQMHLEYPGKAYKKQGVPARPVNPDVKSARLTEALGESPVITVPQTTLLELQAAGYNPETRHFDWLKQPHFFTESANGDLEIHLPGGHQDLGLYTASGVGSAMDLPGVDIHWANPAPHLPQVGHAVTKDGGAFTADEARAIQQQLQGVGLRGIVSPDGSHVKVPWNGRDPQAIADTLGPALDAAGIDGYHAGAYRGSDTHVPAAEYGLHLEQGRDLYGPRASGSRGVPGGPGGTGPPSGGAESGAGPGALPGAERTLGAFTGLGASQAGTDEDTTPEERAKRAAAGLGAGLLGVRFGRRAATTAASREGFAGNIRLQKYPEDVRRILQQAADANPQMMESARRGVLPDSVIADLAKYSGIDVAKITRTWQPGKAQNAETLLALRDALAARARTVRSAQEAYRAADTTENLTRLMSSVTEHAALQEVVSGTTAEAGRALRQFRQSVQGLQNPQDRLDALLKLAYKNGKRDDLEKFLAGVDLEDPVSVANAARTLYNPKLPDLASWLWYNGLLSNPAGRLRDMISSAIATATYPLERGASVPFDIAQSKLLGTPRTVYARQVPAEYAGMASALQEGWKNALQVVGQGFTAEQARGDLGFVSREPASVDVAGRRIPIPGGLRAGISMPSRITAANDAFFGTLDRQATANSIAIRRAKGEGLSGARLADRADELARNPDAAMLDEMASTRKYRVWQEGGKFNDALNTLKNLPGLRVIIPFTQTPLNLTKYALERSPAGLAMLVGEHAGAAAGYTTRPTTAHTSEMLGRAAMGSTIMGGLLGMVQQGLVTGPAPESSAERDAFYRQGKQPYSVQIGGAWHDYRTWAMAPVLGSAAAVHDAVEKNQIGDASAMFSMGAVGVAKAMLDQSFMQGLTGFANALNDPGRRLPSFLEGTARSVVPQALQVVARATDPYLRNPSGSLPESISQAVTSSIPGLQGTAPPRLQAFGEPRARPELQQGIGALNPLRSSEVRNDPVETELARLQRSGYKVEPDMVDATLQVGQAPGPTADVKLTQTEQDRYQEIAGKTAYAYLAPAMADPKWASTPDSEKEKYIRDVVAGARKEAKQLMTPYLAPRAAEQYNREQQRKSAG